MQTTQFGSVKALREFLHQQDEHRLNLANQINIAKLHERIQRLSKQKTLSKSEKKSKRMNLGGRLDGAVRMRNSTRIGSIKRLINSSKPQIRSKNIDDTNEFALESQSELQIKSKKSLNFAEKDLQIGTNILSNVSK